MQQPRFENLPETRLIGQQVTMSFAENKTHELWRQFMPRRHEIKNSVNEFLYSIEVYPPDFFTHFNPTRPFEKWAAVPVADHSAIPDAMESITLPGGLYAIFIYRGPASKAMKTYMYIYQEWLPKSDYLLDKRPHFALMGEKYKNESPDSEEEIWIPVKHKEMLSKKAYTQSPA